MNKRLLLHRRAVIGMTNEVQKILGVGAVLHDRPDQLVEVLVGIDFSHVGLLGQQINSPWAHVMSLMKNL
jgi:hypothetical protein